MSNYQSDQFGNTNNSNPIQDNANNNNYNQYNNNSNPYNNFNNQNWQNNNVWNNNNNNKPNDRLAALKVAKTNANCYIAFVILAFLLIFIGCVMWLASILSASPYSSDNAFIGPMIGSAAFFILGGIFALATIICGIIAIVYSASLKNIYNEEFDTVFILSAIGIIVPLLTFIACCMTVSKAKKLLASSSDNNGYVNRSSSNPY